MSPKTHPLVQQLLQSFEGIDFECVTKSRGYKTLLLT